MIVVVQLPVLLSINPSDRARVRVQVLRDHYCPQRECWAMEWEIWVIWDDLGATSGTSSDLRHTEHLMPCLRPQAAELMAIKSPSSNKETGKFEPCT